MFRTTFFATGLCVVLGGAGLFFVDEVTLTKSVSNTGQPLLEFLTRPATEQRRSLNPPDWMPFTCIGIGGVTMLYAIALPRE